MKHTWMTTEEVCQALGISQSTWKKWRAAEKGPRAKKLPNGSLRVRADWVDEWMEGLLDVGGRAA